MKEAAMIRICGRTIAGAVAIAACAAGWLSASQAIAQSSALPAPISQAIRSSEAASANYNFDLRYETTDGLFNARFDPGAAGPGLVLTSPQRAELPPSLRTDFDTLQQRITGVTWCAGSNLAHITDVRLVREDDQTWTYSFQPTEQSVTGDMTRRIVERLRGELVVSKGAWPDVIRSRLFLARPFSPMPLANIDRYTVTTSCAMAPNGRRYSAELNTDTHGTFPGRTITMRANRRVSNLRAAP